MFSVQLRRGLTGDELFESFFKVFDDIVQAIDFSIRHHHYFVRLMYHNGDICRDIYTRIECDGEGGFDLILECEYLG